MAASGGPDSDIIHLLAYTGLRWGEMAALKVKRVDLERRRLDVAEVVTEREGEIIWGTPKTHERRPVPFPAFLKDAMTSRTEGKKADDLVFPSLKGDVLRNGNFRRRRFDVAVETLQAKHPELPKITPHSLRHTAASLAISAGATVLAVQRMMDHASAAVTLDV